MDGLEERGFFLWTAPDSGDDMALLQLACMANAFIVSKDRYAAEITNQIVHIKLNKKKKKLVALVDRYAMEVAEIFRDFRVQSASALDPADVSNDAIASQPVAQAIKSRTMPASLPTTTDIYFGGPIKCAQKESITSLHCASLLR
eukprot:IDg22786t1